MTIDTRDLIAMALGAALLLILLLPALLAYLRLKLRAQRAEFDLHWARRETEERLLQAQLAQLREQGVADAAQFKAERGELQQRLQAEQQAQQRLHADNAGLRTELEQQRLHMQEKLTLLQEARAQLVQAFENSAHKIFEDKQQTFSLHSREALEQTLNPLRQQLGEFRKRVDDVYSAENAERHRLMGQITELQKQTQKIGADAINLANALKGDNKAQGNWGEVVLERLLEESGLQKGREYETQVALKGDVGERRNPDVIVRLPEQKDIIIDAKVSLLHYERYCSEPDPALRAQHLKAHIQSLRAHIGGLSLKDYEKLEGIRTLDFVFIFVPVEAAFMAALQEEPALFREAYDKHIVLVSPTTLLATLRTVESIWRYEKQNRNAEKIAAVAGGLYDQFVALLEALDEVGKAIGRTQEAFDKARARLGSGRGNLIKRADDIRKLGAKTKKQLKGELVEQALADDDYEAELLLGSDAAPLDEVAE